MLLNILPQRIVVLKSIIEYKYIILLLHYFRAILMIFVFTRASST